MKSCNRAVLSVVLLFSGCVAGAGVEGRAVAALGSPPPVVTVTQRSDGLAISWTSIQEAVSYSVLRGGAPLVSVNAPTTSYIDTDVFAGSTYCYQVAGVFDDGSQTPPSNQFCVVVGGSAASKTMQIAINGPRVGASPGFQGDALYMSGAVQSAVFQIAGIPLGSVITGARVRIRDSSTGPTRLQVQLFPSADGSQSGPPIATSATSAGTGAAQTLSVSGLATILAPLTTYSIYVSSTTGSAQVSVTAVEVDYRP